MGNHELTVRFRKARRDPELTVVEGFHALKHALRFGAELVEAVAVDPEALEALARELAPDLAGQLAGRVETIAPEDLAELVPLVPRTGVVAIARRPPVDLAAVLADPRPAPVVLLEQPKNMGNIGACVRVAAAADAAAVLTTGENDPWYPDAVRGAAGLHFALPVAAVESLPRATGRCWRSTPRGRTCDPAACRRAPCSPSGPSATGSAPSCSSAPTPASRFRCGPASPASTSPPRLRWRCSRCGLRPELAALDWEIWPM